MTTALEIEALDRATLLFVEGFFQLNLVKAMEGLPLYANKEQILLAAMEMALAEQVFKGCDVVSLWRAGKMDKKDCSLLCWQALQLLSAQRERQNVHLGSD